MHRGTLVRGAAAASTVASLRLPQLRASLGSQRDLDAVRRGPAPTAAVTPALRRLCCSPLSSLTACEATRVGRRWAASYPQPRKREKQSSSRKMYNYLTQDRLVQKARRVSDATLRQTDDQRLLRRRNYKAQMQRDVDEKIRFFSPELKRLIFFPRQRNSDRRCLFLGNREFALSTTTRLHAGVLAELRKRANRHVILEVLAEHHVEPPTEEDWTQFTDPETGDINVGLLYSPWALRTLGICGSDMQRGITTHLRSGANQATVAFVLRHIGDRTKVPTLEEWAQQYGPVGEGDMVWRHKTDSTARLAFRLLKNEVQLWGQAAVLDAVGRMSFAEQEELVRGVEAQLGELYAAARRQHLFAAKILYVLYSLPEGRAVMLRSSVFSAVQASLHTIEIKGDFYPESSDHGVRYSSLSSEERHKYACFGRVYRGESLTGRRLFLRYCCRDYGFTLPEAWRRFTELDELQKAAMEFPFFTSIAPETGNAVAFKRFYRESCEHLGLVSVNKARESNRVLRRAIRRRWEQLSVAERQRYHKSTALQGAFPLQPVTSEGAATAAAAAGTSAAEEYDRVTAREKRGEPQAAPAAPTVSIAPALPVLSAPSSYFADEKPPSLRGQTLELTESDLLAEFRTISEVASKAQRAAAAQEVASENAGGGHVTENSEVAADAAPNAAAADAAERRAEAHAAPLSAALSPAPTHTATSSMSRLKASTPKPRQPAVRVIMI